MVSLKKTLIAAGAAVLLSGVYGDPGKMRPQTAPSARPAPSPVGAGMSLEGVLSRMRAYDVSGIRGRKASPGLLRDFVRHVIPSHPYSGASFRVLTPKAYDSLVHPGIDGDFLKSSARTVCSLESGRHTSYSTLVRGEDASSALFYASVEVAHMVYRSHPSRAGTPCSNGGAPCSEELFCWLLAEACPSASPALRAASPMAGAVGLAVSRAGSLEGAASILCRGNPRMCDYLTRSPLYLKFNAARSEGLEIPADFEGKTVPEALLAGWIRKLDPAGRKMLAVDAPLQDAVRSIVDYVTRSAIPADRIRVGSVDPVYWQDFLRDRRLADQGGYCSRRAFDGDRMYLDVIVKGSPDLKVALRAVGQMIFPSTRQEMRGVAGGIFLEACGY